LTPRKCTFFGYFFARERGGFQAEAIRGIIRGQNRRTGKGEKKKGFTKYPFLGTLDKGDISSHPKGDKEKGEKERGKDD